MDPIFFVTFAAPAITVSIPEKPFVGNVQKGRPESSRQQQTGYQDDQNEAQRHSF
jgi:hypothetical protein